MKKTRIVLHGSASKWGDVDAIREWHLERGWSDIGYNLVIENGFPQYDDWVTQRRLYARDGKLSPGRDLNDNPHDWMGEQGAHALGYNMESIGICMISDTDLLPTRKQIQSAMIVCACTVNLYDMKWQDVMGHYELDDKKTDPYIDMNEFRDHLANEYLYATLSDWIYHDILELVDPLDAGTVA